MYIEKYTGLYSYTSQTDMFQPTTHPLFVTWRMMNVRCYDTRHKAYHRYGGRGIQVCQEWRWDNPHGFRTFVKDVGERPKGLTLDRIENNKGYSKDNCKWADKRTQQNNLGKGLCNTSGAIGVCKIENSYIVQIYLNGTTKMVGVFNLEDYELAIDRYEKVKSVKMQYGDNAALDFVKTLDFKTPTNKRLRRNKTAEHYGVHLCARSGLWIASTTYRLTKDSPLLHKHLGRYKTQVEAYNEVLKFIEWVEANGYYKKKS